LIEDLAVKRFPPGDVFLAVHQGKSRTRNDGNIGAADNFEEAQSVQDFFVAPGVTGGDGDAEDIGVGRLHEGEDGLRVGTAGAGAIFIDDNFAFFLGREGRGGGNNGKNQEREEDTL